MTSLWQRRAGSGELGPLGFPYAYARVPSAYAGPPQLLTGSGRARRAWTSTRSMSLGEFAM